MNKVWAGIIGGILGMAVAGWATAQTVQRPLPSVDTASGKIIGMALDSGVHAWLGVPYAAAPVNGLRWKPPQPISWKGSWNADRLMPECIQSLRHHSINNYFGEEATSEDCLYLNIWAPANAAPSSRLPVIFYIFGGGNTIGSPGMGVYNGEAIASRGAIFVGINYRLGVLGFMAHPELSAEQSGHSGNYAFLDQAAALRWVHDNIAKFGGDPSKVMIMGQSAGAGAVALHLVSPLSKGLFSSATMLSMCGLDRESPSLAEAERNGSAIQARLGAANLEEMRAMPADKILTAQPLAHIGATLDGYFLPKQPLAMIQAHEDSAVPIITSSTGDDNDARQSPLTKAKTIVELRAAASALYGNDATTLLKLYGVKRDSDVPVAAYQIAQDAGMQGSNRRCAQIRQQYDQTATYIALFNRKHPYVSGVKFLDVDPVTVGAYHSSDVPYWFGTFDAYNRMRLTRAWTAQDRSISDRLADTLIAFARSGNPSTKAVAWPAWSSERQERLAVDADISVEPMRVKALNWLAQHPAVRRLPAPPQPHKDGD